MQTKNTDLGLLILRLTFGLTMALAHGFGKLPPSPKFVEGLTAMGMPLPYAAAWLAGFSEFLGGLLIAAGLATRPAALFLAATMSVAAFIAHAADPFRVKEMALLFLAFAVTILFTGAGRYSLDAVICSKSKKRKK